MLITLFQEKAARICVVGTLLNVGRDGNLGGELLNRITLFCFFGIFKKYSCSFTKYMLRATDVTWTVLPMFCCVSGPENISVVLLSMEGLRALRFNQKYLNLCSEG